MKKTGTLNAQLSRVIASSGHSDRLVVCDSGLPIPRGSEVVDLALTANIPRFLDTLRVVLEELCVESAIVATEMEQRGNGIYEEMLKLLPGLPLQKVPHERFKELTCENGNTFFVRTGEATPFANIILVCGVTFG